MGYLCCFQAYQSNDNEFNEILKDFYQKVIPLTNPGDSQLFNMLIRSQNINIKEIIQFVSLIENKLVLYHLMRVKFFINDNCSINEIYTRILDEMESRYKIPIDVLFI